MPPVKDASWPLTPVDWFVLAKLEQRGWGPAAKASRAELMHAGGVD